MYPFYLTYPKEVKKKVPDVFFISLWLLICLSLFLPSQIFSRTDVTLQSLTEDLHSREIDRIAESLNQVKSMSYNGHILPFIQDLWEQREDKYPSLPWEIIELEIVRVELANILGQAIKNEEIRMALPPIHNYLSDLIFSTDSPVARKAIGALSLIGDETDVAKILTVAKKVEPRTFRIAVATLTMMCNEKAKKALVELKETITKSEFLSIINDNIRESEDFKRDTQWCDH